MLHGWVDALNPTADRYQTSECLPQGGEARAAGRPVGPRPLRAHCAAVLARVWGREAGSRGIFFDLTFVGLWLALALTPWSLWFSSKVHLAAALKTPSWSHPLGTDSLGRDLLVRLGEAIQHSVLPLWLAVGMGLLIGGGWAIFCLSLPQARIWRPFLTVMDAGAVGLAAIPAGVMAFAWGAWRQRVDLAGVMWTLTILCAVRMYLLVRDLERRDHGLGYWTAHKALGGSTVSRLWTFGVRGAWTWELLEQITLSLRVAVATEAAVSYLGFGVAEPAASFGNMLATHFDYYLKGHLGVVLPIICGLALTASFPAAVLRLVRSMKQWLRTFV